MHLSCVNGKGTIFTLSSIRRYTYTQTFIYKYTLVLFDRNLYSFDNQTLQFKTSKMAEAVSSAQVEKGENARMASFVGALAIADLVKTTLGPKGMDKILQSMTMGGDITITNDGATILKAIHIDNAAAKVLVEISKTQDDEVGDGTTSVVVLAGELLREAQRLMDKRVHPMTIIDGFRLAADIGRKALIASAVDSEGDKTKIREAMVNVAQTTLSSKILSSDKKRFSNLAVDAVLRLEGSTDLDLIQIIKKPGGSLVHSYLEDGFLLNKKIGVGQPKRIENAKILVANTPMDTDKVKIYGSRVRVSSMNDVAAIEAAEKKKMKDKCLKIVNHGINVFINRQLIYNYPESIFAENNVMAIEHADFDGIERLAAVLGGEICSTFDHPELVTLGGCELIEEIMVGEDSMIRFKGVKGGAACSIVLRGPSLHVLDEAERSLHDALAVLSQMAVKGRIVYGGGCSESLMAAAIDKEVPKTSGKKQLAMEAFARALRQLPATIADNAGYDSADIVANLRAAHAAGNVRAGIDISDGGIGDMTKLGICESFELKEHVLMAAAEAAEMILRVDDIIKSAPRQRQQQGMPGMGGM
jgi:T-complex protein 1 subunit beta